MHCLFHFKELLKTFSVDADRLITKVFEENGSGGIALVVKEGNVLYRKAFGMADMELQVKNDTKQYH